jgi:hypothetical protein
MSSKSKVEEKSVLKEKEQEDLHEDEDGEEEEEEEEEYAEAEPVLTYSRMKNDVNEILTQDSVSCIKAGHKVSPSKKTKRGSFLVSNLKKITHPFSLKILVLGTHFGRIHIMDHDGNKNMTKENVNNLKKNSFLKKYRNTPYLVPTTNLKIFFYF